MECYYERMTIRRKAMLGPISVCSMEYSRIIVTIILRYLLETVSEVRVTRPREESRLGIWILQHISHSGVTKHVSQSIDQTTNDETRRTDIFRYSCHHQSRMWMMMKQNVSDHLYHFSRSFVLILLDNDFCTPRTSHILPQETQCEIRTFSPHQ